MRHRAIVIASGRQDAVLEEKINNTSAILKEMARRKAKHFAARNQPAPIGDVLSHYTDEFKAGCEQRYAEVCLLLLPASNFPDAKIDHDHFKEKENALNQQIKTKENENLNDHHELSEFDPKGFSNRITIAGILTFIILLGEILFNAKAFQVTGENFLFALVISISTSVGVFLFAHMAPFLYKEAKTVIKRRVIIFSSLALALVLFTALAIFRSTYLETNNVHIKPIYFVVINLFFFIVSALLSYFVLPAWHELKEHSIHLKQHKKVLVREKEIKQLKDAKEELQSNHVLLTKHRVRSVYTANYVAERFRKLYWECLAIFKSTNLACREDRETPDCFSQNLPEPDITETTIHQLNSNKKSS